jgi:peptidoglycan/LPS O-acetylase OafA/YrhL
MFAIIAALVFGFALLLDLLNSNLGAPDLFNWHTLVLIGLLSLALYMAGVGTGPGGGRWYRGRRPGRG